MNKLIFQPKALLLIKDTVQNYAEINPILEEAFKDELRERLQILRTNPLLWKLRYKTIRIALFKRFPYSIHYSVEGNITTVIEVLHQRQLYGK